MKLVAAYRARDNVCYGLRLPCAGRALNDKTLPTHRFLNCDCLRAIGICNVDKFAGAKHFVYTRILGD